MPPTKADRDKAAKIISYEVRDPLTETRKCRWCGLDAPAQAQSGGEYRCPGERGGCGRWQHERAFPDGVPGLTQETVICVACGAVSGWDALSDAPRACPACGGRALSAKEV